MKAYMNFDTGVFYTEEELKDSFDLYNEEDISYNEWLDHQLNLGRQKIGGLEEIEVVTLTVYADTVYPDLWYEPDKYGDDNTAWLNVNKTDLLEWLEQSDWIDEQGLGFMDSYTHDDTNDLYGWLKENRRYVEVVQ